MGRMGDVLSNVELGQHRNDAHEMRADHLYSSDANIEGPEVRVEEAGCERTDTR